jgi:hypothetical protein
MFGVRIAALKFSQKVVHSRTSPLKCRICLCGSLVVFVPPLSANSAVAALVSAFCCCCCMHLLYLLLLLLHRLAASALKLWAKSNSNSIFEFRLTKKNWVWTVHKIKSNKRHSTQFLRSKCSLSSHSSPLFCSKLSLPLFRSEVRYVHRRYWPLFVIAKKNKRELKNLSANSNHSFWVRAPLKLKDNELCGTQTQKFEQTASLAGPGCDHQLRCCCCIWMLGLVAFLSAVYNLLYLSPATVCTPINFNTHWMYVMSIVSSSSSHLSCSVFGRSFISLRPWKLP